MSQKEKENDALNPIFLLIAFGTIGLFLVAFLRPDILATFGEAYTRDQRMIESSGSSNYYLLIQSLKRHNFSVTTVSSTTNIGWNDDILGTFSDWMQIRSSVEVNDLIVRLKAESTDKKIYLTDVKESYDIPTYTTYCELCYRKSDGNLYSILIELSSGGLG